MSAPKTNCRKCGTEILQSTADATAGLCMPCKKGRRRTPRPGEPIPVSCKIQSLVEPDPLFHTTAQILLAELETTPSDKDDEHPNRYEMDAQRALLRHAIKHRVELQLHEDHWDQTKWALVSIFERGEAEIEVDAIRYKFSDLTKEKWKTGVRPMMERGGFSYTNHKGEPVFITMTWIS